MVFTRLVIRFQEAKKRNIKHSCKMEINNINNGSYSHEELHGRNRFKKKMWVNIGKHIPNVRNKFKMSLSPSLSS